MYVRVVRFTDVDQQRMEALLARVGAADGPPEGVPSTGIQMLFDEGQRTVVVLQHCDSAEDLRVGAEALEKMDPSETPGTRASVDACEVKLELHASGG